ncbi:MAG: YkgJ family cysteine cluster protein [Thermodesulfobacteriota bacterium]
MDRIEKLEQLYELHEKWINNNNYFCKKGCAKCCTLNVAATSLEAELIIKKAGPSYIKMPEKIMEYERFHPTTTTNKIANLAIENIDPPEEYLPQSDIKCPYLDNNECIIYDIRPLACRIQLSQQDCGQSKIAVIDEKTMTINTVFQQYIELLDHDGLSGNIFDLLVHGSNPVFTSKFINNEIPKAVMVPPEFREELKQLIKEIHEIIYAGQN